MPIARILCESLIEHTVASLTLPLDPYLRLSPHWPHSGELLLDSRIVHAMCKEQTSLPCSRANTETLAIMGTVDTTTMKKVDMPNKIN